MWNDLLSAVALLLVLEGIMPFTMPHVWRSFLSKVIQSDDKSLRIMGFIMMLMGLALIYIVKSKMLPF